MSSINVIGQERNTNENNVKITISNKNRCFFLHEWNELCFKIKNLGDEPIWINSGGLLMFFNISNETGQEISPYLKFEETTKSQGFILIKEKSEQNICLHTNTLIRFKLEKDKEYNLKATYFSSIAKKRTKFKTLNEKVDMPAFSFEICSMRID